MIKHVDTFRTKASNEKFREGWDEIFKKKEETEENETLVDLEDILDFAKKNKEDADKSGEEMFDILEQEAKEKTEE